MKVTVTERLCDYNKEHREQIRKDYIEAKATESDKGMASNHVITIKYTKMMLCVCCA
jgi:hypothetical protein